MNRLNEMKTKIARKVATFTLAEWGEVVLWASTLIVLIAFSIIAVELGGYGDRTLDADAIAAVAVLFSVLLFGSLAYTVFLRYMKSRNKKAGVNRR